MSDVGATRTRREFFREAGIVAGGAATLTIPGARQALVAGRRRAQRVAVFGGGVAGLTAAHELAERGFDVTVYERRAWGGKARSIPVPSTAAGGRRALPGEHGFRSTFGVYHNLPDTLRRIPDPATGHTVFDNLVATGSPLGSRPGAREDLVLLGLLPVAGPPNELTAKSLLLQLLAAGQWHTDVPPDEFAFIARQVAMYMTGSEERRLRQWEHISWWDYMRAAQMSPSYQAMVRTITGIQAIKPKDASARTFMNAAETLVYWQMGRAQDGPLDRVLNAPTNEAWIIPWTQLLRELDARLRLGHTVEALELRRGQIVSARVADQGGTRRDVEADWFVCALPMERARRLWNREILAADPSLKRMAELRAEWETGIQLYLRREAPIHDGHVSYATPWVLFSISQAQFWARDFKRDYGNGDVRDCLSVVISDWDTPGILYGKPARECTPRQIAGECWAQIKSCLEDTGRTYLPDEILHSFFLDPAITYPRGGSVHARNEDQLFANLVSSWDHRPPTTGRIPNLFLAGDYVQTDFDVASMEAACESGRAAANAVLAAADSNAPAAEQFQRYHAPELDAAKRVDAQRFKQGQPHVLDGPWPN